MLSVYRILCVSGVLFAYINGVPKYPIACGVFSMVAVASLWAFVNKNKAALVQLDRNDPKAKKVIFVFAGSLILHAVIIATLHDMKTESNQAIQTTTLTYTPITPRQSWQHMQVRI
jgi:hypothetical protein